MTPIKNFDGTDRRNAPRHRFRLAGRYMLFDRSEWICETVNISTTGMLLMGTAFPNLGQTVVVYLETLGRLEGTVVRLKPIEFAVHIRAAECKRQRLSLLLAAHAAGEAVPRHIYSAVYGAGGHEPAALAKKSELAR